MFKFSLIAAAILTLSACSGGPSAGTERTQTQGNQLNFSVGASRSLTASTNLSTSAQVPLAYYIQEVARDVNFATGVQVLPFMMGVLRQNLPPVTSSGAEWVDMVSPTGEITEAHKKKALEQAAHIEQRLGHKSPVADVPLKHLMRCVDLVLTQNDYAAARDCYTDYYTRITVAASIAVAYYPQVSPMVGSISTQPGNTRTYATDIIPWARGTMAVIDVTNQVSDQLIGVLGGVTLADDDAAKEALALALFDLPAEPLRKGQKQFREDAAPGEDAVYYSHFVPVEKVQRMVADPSEISAPIKIAFPDLNRHITQDGRGLTEMRAGGLHFGADTISGKKYMLTVANSASASMTKQDDSRSGQDAGAGANTRAGVTLGTQ